jgi:mRNA interferase MazF
MTLEQRGIVLIPVPFSDLSSVKRRPVLVLSSYEYNSTSSDVVVAAITSNPSSGPYGIRITSEELDRGILPVESFVRADKLYTLSQAIILKRFGRVNESVFKVILSEIDKIYGKEPIPNSA